MVEQEQIADLAAIAFAEVSSARIRAFDVLWRAKAGQRLCPSRAEIDPGEIKDLLPYLILADIEYAPFRVRYRLCGTRISTSDDELTGRYLDEIASLDQPTRDFIQAQYQEACRDARPTFSRGQLYMPRSKFHRYMEAGVWPLSSDGKTIDKCAAIEDVDMNTRARPLGGAQNPA